MLKLTSKWSYGEPLDTDPLSNKYLLIYLFTLVYLILALHCFLTLYFLTLWLSFLLEIFSSLGIDENKWDETVSMSGSDNNKKMLWNLQTLLETLNSMAGIQQQITWHFSYLVDNLHTYIYIYICKKHIECINF